MSGGAVMEDAVIGAAPVDGADLHYRVSGQGEPLVLISGTSMDHQMWDLQVPSYSRHYTTVTYDNRGTGRSSSPPMPVQYSPAIMAGDLAGLLDHLGIDRAHVSGVSLGSAIAQEFALAYPDRVASLQLHATWGRSDEWFRNALVGTVQYAMRHHDRRKAFKASLMWIMSAAYLDHREPAEVRDLVTRVVVRNPHLPTDDGFVGHLRADAVHDTLDRLGEITAPTLITVGERDVCTPPWYGHAVHDAMPGSQMITFTGERASHCSLWELWPEFNERTLEFLAQHAMGGEAHVESTHADAVPPSA